MTELRPEITQRPSLTSVALNRIPSEVLMQGHSEVIIVHQSREYRLRITQTGKLILTT